MSIYQVDGKKYGVPFDFGIVGFWYNKDLFSQAGITAPPTTWDELLADVGKLKAAGIAPIALGEVTSGRACSGGPTSSLRIGGQAALEQAVNDERLRTTRPSSRPARSSKKLIDLKPFQQGFLAAGYGKDGGRDHGQRQGRHGADGPVGARRVQKGDSASKQGIGDKLGWFPFPAVDGGAGSRPTCSVAAMASPSARTPRPRRSTSSSSCSSLDVAKRYGALRRRHPADRPTGPRRRHRPDPQDRRSSSVPRPPFAQLYLDQATTPALGAAINDAIQKLFAGNGNTGRSRHGDRQRGEDPVTFPRRGSQRAGSDAGPFGLSRPATRIGR